MAFNAFKQKVPGAYLKTTRNSAAGPLSATVVREGLTARCGDARSSPSRRLPKSLIARPLVGFKQALGAGLIAALALGIVSLPSYGGEFRMSFLNEGSALEDTCRLLKQSGVPPETLSTFCVLVNYQNQLGHAEISRFRKPEQGFYHFKNLGDLTNHLNCPLGRGGSPGLQDRATLMCFDFVSLLLAGAGYGTPRLEQEFKGSGIVLPIPGGPLPSPVHDPKYQLFRESYSLALCPESDFARLLGRPRSRAETELELSLIAPHSLVETEPDWERNIRLSGGASSRAMERFGFKYGGGLELGLVLCADFKGHTLSADHAFVCLHQGGRLICLEKTSPQGPYVRSDFHSEKDLAQYELSTYVDYPLRRGQVGYGCPMVVTLGKRILTIHQPVARALSSQNHMPLARSVGERY
jgi:hypothetical protein